MLTQERLKELVYYNKHTGVFTQKKSRKGVSNVGKVAGCKKKHGYWHISIDDIVYGAHRLAWLYVHGYFPEHCIDHINRVRDDNRLVNLREVTYSCNLRNSGIGSMNSSGVKGVCWFPRTNKWRAFITVDGKQLHLGYHEDMIGAVIARHDKEVELDWADCDTSSSALAYINKYKESNV